MVVTQFIAIVGAALVAYLVYLYAGYRTAETRERRQGHREQFTKALVSGAFILYLLSVVYPRANAWPVAIGNGIGNLLAFSGAPGNLNQVEGSGAVIYWVKVLGLVAYTAVWLTASLSGQFLVKLYHAIFG